MNKVKSGEMMRYLIILAIMVLFIPATRAKAPTDRIVITGPMIDAELVVTDPELTLRLTMGSLENFEVGAIARPESLSEIYYDLERQYEVIPGLFQTFDRVRYYPDMQAIQYLGTTSPGIWYQATTKGSLAMHTLIDAAPYVILISPGGMIELIDPDTLLSRLQIKLDANTPFSPEYITTLDMHTLYFKSQGLHHRFELDTDYYCVSKYPPMLLDDGLLSFDWMVELNSREWQTTTLTQERLQRWAGTLPAQWQTRPKPGEIVAGGDHLYALENNLNAAIVYQMDGQTSAPVNSRMLYGDDWRIGYGWLNLDGVKIGAVANQC